MKKLFLALIFVTTCAIAASLPYDESVNANEQVKQAFDAAQSSKKPVLIIFGANWCPDCRALDKAMQLSKNARLINTEFSVVKVDVGNFDHNLNIDKAYGHPIKTGIPAAVLVSYDKKILYATQGGELANARRMSDTGVYDFFKQMAKLPRK
jgi:protein disulfide-isomerase